MNTNKQSGARKSLRSLLMMWLLMFSVVPLAFITGYSVVKYEQAINQELLQRLMGNGREIQVIFNELHGDLLRQNVQHASDKSLIYFLTSNAFSKARDLASGWMRNQLTQFLSVSSREGRLEVSLYRDVNGDILRQANIEGTDKYMTKEFMEGFRRNSSLSLVEFADEAVDLIVSSQIRASNGMTAGFIDETFRIDRGFIESLKNRMDLEFVIVSEDGQKHFASHEDLLHYRKGFFLEQHRDSPERLIDLNIRETPYGFMVKELQWGDQKFLVALGASKKESTAVLKNVNYAFFSVVGTIVLLLIFLSFIFSKVMLHPINSLVALVQNVDFSKEPERVHYNSENEIGILTESFNDMISRVYRAQNELKENISKLEDANAEIRRTQSQLVQSAKMASLGQLVAGVAHELNNPISFIYGNMGHLKDYTQKLVTLLKTAESNPDKLEKEKEKLEYDYILKDLPKLIRSCEDGAQRTRDIVVGLRNFSRLDEAKLKEVDIHEGIESTLTLLASEFKTRIKIERKFGEIPRIMCYPSQLNQVFMNILSNAAQAIPDQGKIEISTELANSKHVLIKIADTGTGMSQETAEKIFDPFYTTKEVNKGTGLGMSISYSIIKKHNGEIQVKSAPGQGTTFIITLPIQLEG